MPDSTVAIGVVVFDGVEELDFVGPWEVLRSAMALGADAAVKLYSVTESLRVTAAHGLGFEAEAPLGTDHLDIVIVPGGGWNNRATHGTRAEVDRGRLSEMLVDMHDNGTMLASVCTGGMVLASAGLLTGRRASTHKRAAADLALYGAQYVEAIVVDEGDVVSSGGVVAGIDLALWLVERYFGAPLRAAVEEKIEYVRRDPVWTAAAGSTAI